MKKINFLIVFVHLLIGTATFGQETLDQSQLLFPQGSGLNSSTPITIYQTFKAGLTGPLTKVSLQITAFTDTATISIMATDSNGVPTGPNLCQVNVNEAPNSNSFTDAVFPTPINVVAGTTYAIKITKSNYYLLYYNYTTSTDAYSNGKTYYTTATQTTPILFFGDFFDCTFKTYVQVTLSLSDSILAQIGNEGDLPNTIPSVVTTTQLGQITPAITGIIVANQSAYQAYIDTNPNSFSSPATATEVQAMITTVNAQVAATVASNTVLTQIGNEGDTPNVITSVVTILQLYQILPTITGIIPTNQTAYQAYIDANPNSFSSPATAAEVQTMINAVNATTSITFYVDASKTDNSGDGLSWATAKKDLQVILDNYGNNPGPNVNEVWVKAGVYFPTTFVGTSTAARDKAFWVKGNIKIYGGFSGTETTLNQRNITNNQTILDASGGYHAMLVTNSNATSTLTLIDGITIKGGNANGTSANTVSGIGYERNFGGGVLCYKNAATFNNVIFKSNTAEYGAGVFNQGGAPKYNNCVFTSNSSTSYGGGIENFENSNPVFNNCVISNNSAFRGGAAANNGGTVTYTNCTIAKNIATVDVASGAFIDLNNTTSNYKNCIIWNNTTGDFITNAGSTSNVSYSVTQTTQVGTSNLTTDPQFIDINDGDGPDNKWFTSDDGFNINPSSNCTNTGNSSAIPTYSTVDIINNPRINGSSVDRGAYEVAGALNMVRFNASSVNIYPNPTNGILTLELEEFHNTSTKIIDFNGRVLDSKELNEVQTTFDVSHLTSGMYFLQINSEKGTIIQKFIKK